MQLVENLPNFHDSLDSTPALHKMRVVLHTCNLRSQEVEAEESEISGHPWLQIKFEASLGYRTCLQVNRT